MFMHTYDYTNRTNAILIDLQKKNQHHIRFYITWIRGIQGTTENLKKKKEFNQRFVIIEICRTIKV